MNQKKACEIARAEATKLEALSDILKPQYELPCFLIKPIQRICKYPLLLQQLVKYTDSDAPNYQDQVDALEAIRRVTLNVNETQRRVENLSVVKDLSERLVDWKGHNLDDFGALLHDGVFPVIKAGAEREYHLYLFENIILCCKEASGSKKAMTLTTKKSKNKRSSALILKGRIYIAYITNIFTVNSGGYFLHIAWGRDDSSDTGFFDIRFRNDELLDQWYTTINQMVSRYNATAAEPYDEDNNSQQNGVGAMNYNQYERQFGLLNPQAYAEAGNIVNGTSYDDASDDEVYGNGNGSNNRAAAGLSGNNTNNSMMMMNAASQIHGATGTGSGHPQSHSYDGESFSTSLNNDFATLSYPIDQAHQGGGNQQKTMSYQHTPTHQQISSISEDMDNAHISNNGGSNQHLRQAARQDSSLSIASFSGGHPTNYQAAARSRSASVPVINPPHSQGYGNVGLGNSARGGPGGIGVKSEMYSSNNSSGASTQSSISTPSAAISGSNGPGGAALAGPNSAATSAANSMTDLSETSMSSTSPARVLKTNSVTNGGNIRSNGSSHNILQQNLDMGSPEDSTNGSAAGASWSTGQQQAGYSTSQYGNGNGTNNVNNGVFNAGQGNNNSSLSGTVAHLNMATGGSSGMSYQQKSNGKTLSTVSTATTTTTTSTGTSSTALNGGTSKPPQMKVKLHYLDDTFLLIVPFTVTYDQLLERVGRKIRLCGKQTPNPLRIKYKDEDDDFVTMRSDEDIQMALEPKLGENYMQLLQQNMKLQMSGASVASAAAAASAAMAAASSTTDKGSTGLSISSAHTSLIGTPSSGLLGNRQDVLTIWAT